MDFRPGPNFGRVFRKVHFLVYSCATAAGVIDFGHHALSRNSKHILPQRSMPYASKTALLKAPACTASIKNVVISAENSFRNRSE